MNKSSATIMAAALMLASSCTEVKQEGQGYEPIIGKQEITIKDGRLTPEALWAMGRIGSLSISPDGKKIAYTVAYYSVSENKSHHVIYVMNTDGKNNTLLTQTAWNESEPQWIKGGTKIAFLCNESGGSQIWEMNPDGTERRIISDFKGDIEGFSFSPDGKKILFISQIKYGQRTVDLYPDLPKASGIIVNDLMYKHWDEWVESIPHPFIADFNGNMMGAATDIMEGEPFEAPMKPFGGIEQLAWSNDSKQIAYTSRKKQGLAYAVSTDSDIYLYNIEKGTTLNLCKLNGQDSNGTDEMRGYDTNPKFSPDGKYIAWQSMERDGYESDRNRLCVYNLNNGQKTFVTESFESGVDDYCWNNDSQSLYFIGVWHGTSMVYSTNLNGDIKKLTDGMYDYGSVAMAGDKIITKRHSISAADEIYTLTPADGQVAQLSHENDHIFKQLKLGKVEERWTKTTDGKQMLSWVIYPTNFDANKKYPTLLFCEGGPQSPVSQFWSYRWNFQLMAANGYIVVAPNRRGVPSFGQEWLDQISGDYSGQNIRDYLSAIDDVAKEPWVDKDRLGCVGASYGGYSVYFLAGHHDGRFKAFISHCGIFDFEAMYGSTEELFFLNNDYGGPYWDKQNATAMRTYANSPHKFVDKWDTPIMIITGELDFRIPYTQSLEAFTAARLHGIDARLVEFEDEDHQVMKPQNSVVWNREFFGWLDKYLKK